MQPAASQPAAEAMRTAAAQPASEAVHLPGAVLYPTGTGRSGDHGGCFGVATNGGCKGNRFPLSADHTDNGCHNGPLGDLRLILIAHDRSGNIRGQCLGYQRMRREARVRALDAARLHCRPVGLQQRPVLLQFETRLVHRCKGAQDRRRTQ